MNEIPQWVQDKIANVKLSTQRELDLNGRDKQEKLQVFPTDVSELTWLRKLDLSNNEIKAIPDSIEKLSNSWWLDLSNNQIEAIPERFTKLKGLQRLNLSNNCLQTIPDSINQLTNLEVLNLSGNQITVLPPTIADMYRLTDFFLKDNPIHTPAPEILSLSKPLGKVDIPKTRSYFRKLKEQGFDIIFEAKLIVIGDAEAGKTTLTRKIIDKTALLPETDSRTRGIKIEPWEFSVPANLIATQDLIQRSPKSFVVNIWDFGGHQIYHATHQFFLTKRSFYILVVDGSKQEADFDYWLHVARVHGDNSPVLIVINEKYNCIWQLDEEPRLRKQFENLKDVKQLNLDNNYGDETHRDMNEDRLNRLVKEIQHRITSLNHIGGKIPKIWGDVRRELENINQPYISRQKYFTICEQYGIVDFTSREELSEFLHDLGVCLHFQNEDLLKEIVFLDPEWATNAVYLILDSPDVISNLGHFNRNDLREIWKNAEYEDMHSKLIALMMKFELCYEIPSWSNRSSGRYIAPQLLSRQRPPYKWGETNNLYLYYKAPDFMPRGIISRFIVAMHENIEGQKLVWHDGVVLSFKREGTEVARTEVIERYIEKEIRIRVSGRDRREYLAVVNHKLEEIFKSVPNLSYRQYVPCICQKCKKILSTEQSNGQAHFYSFEVLKRHRSKGITEVLCDESSEFIDLQKLIDDSGISIEVDEQEYDISVGTELRKLILEAFKQNDLVLLCSDHLQIDFNSEFLETKLELKVLELIDWAERRGLLHNLIEACRKERPHINWPRRKSH